MKKQSVLRRNFFWWLIWTALASCIARGADPKAGSASQPLEYVGPGLVDSSSPDGHLLYCPGVQNIEISRANRSHSPAAEDNHDPLGFTYQHHSDLACWKGRLYAAWGVCLKDEDVAPCRIVYSTSNDGFHWTEPQDLYPEGVAWYLRFYFYHARNDRMLAFAVAPDQKDNIHINEAKKHTLLVREITADHQLGAIYTLVRPGLDSPPSFESSSDTGFVEACREAANNKPLLEQQDYGVLLGDQRMNWHWGTNWPDGKVGGFSKKYCFGKALCFFHRQDGAMVGICKLGFATISTNEGQTWSLPVVAPGVVTGIQKMWGQKSPDGRYALIYDPQPYAPAGPRFPMIIDTSEDGITFGNMRVLHGEVPPQRYHGRAKDTGPQYLRGIAEWAGDASTLDKSAFWVIYDMNEEDIWISRIPVPVLPETPNAVHDTFDDIPSGPRVPGWNTYSPIWAPVTVEHDASGNGFLQLEDRDPIDYARAIRSFPPAANVEVSFRLWAEQANNGRLEIDLIGKDGARPVQLALNENGEFQPVAGTTYATLGHYQANQWTDVDIKVADGHYTVVRDGKELVSGAPFTEPSPTVYAISFRTGKFRDTVGRIVAQDVPNTEDPLPPVRYRIDDLITR